MGKCSILPKYLSRRCRLSTQVLVVISEAEAFLRSRYCLTKGLAKHRHLHRTIDIQDVIKTEQLRDEN
jgi:hypothetical protein